MVDPAPEPDDLSRVIADATKIILGVGVEYEPEAARLHALTDRLAAGRFHLAVLGQFKRGKSTLLNALLGEAVLPASVVPLTALPTLIRAGGSPKVTVHLQNGGVEECASGQTEQLSSFLSRFATEEGNPGNRRGVARVELFHPATILSSGVVLIDTPGIGSTFRHNTETTLGFLAECDAAVFLVSADPPITEVEVEFLRQVQSRMARLFFILNKTDYLNPSEREQAVAFFQRVLIERAGVDQTAPIFCVSARQALEARLTDNTALWHDSGMERVERHLIHFLAREKSDALRAAVRRKASDILAEVLLQLRLSLRSLRMPLEDLQSRLAVFDERIVEMERERVAAQDLLTGDKRRTREFLEEQCLRLREKASTALNAALTAAVTGIAEANMRESTLQAVLATRIPEVFEREFRSTATVYNRRMKEVLRPHEERSNRLIESVRKTAAELFEVPYQPPTGADDFEAGPMPYWYTHRWDQSFGPISPSLIDKLTPSNIRRRRLERRYREKIAVLAIQNAGTLREALADRIDEVLHRFGQTLDTRLTATVAATRGAIRAGLAKRKEQSERVADEIAAYESAVADLCRIAAQLEAIPRQKE
jgi:GTP-binding protein EngB required for normal cell division